MTEQLINPMAETYQEYLRDESKLRGFADSISFPKNQQDIIDIIKKINQTSMGITLQGGKTGIVGGAVPLGGHIMNLSRMTKCGEIRELKDGTARISAEPGITLTELEQQIKKRGQGKFFWPVNPTETSASVGGVLSSNARGINAWHYQDSKKYVQSVQIVSGDGTVRLIKRGCEYIEGTEGKTDLLDFIIGGEGAYGAVTQAELVLLPIPGSIWGIAFFFEQLEGADQFTAGLKRIQEDDAAYILACEYMDRKTIDIIESRKQNVSSIKGCPDVPRQFHYMIYMELAGREEGIEVLAQECMETALLCGADEDYTWAVTGETEIKKTRAFRHAAAESVNMFIEEQTRTAPKITKLGSDMSSGKLSLQEAVQFYRRDMEEQQLEGCIFGHIKGMHLHVNLLPHTLQEYERGNLLLEQWAKKIQALGGSPVTEHGFGKLKKSLRKSVLTQEQQKQQETLQKEFDAAGLFRRKPALK